MTVVATAGHVDHGKSTLVRALTGTDPDRLQEEKNRGLTIDLGFAAADLDDGQSLSFIDVPGHTRFLRNMLAGVGAVQGCLFVVAATEGWKPQSEEHLRILELLGIKHGIVALTKIDQVDDELLELAQMDLEEHVEGTFLETAEVVPVAATAGTGIEDLRSALSRLATELGKAPDSGKPRLWVDRSFAARGAGTVVTGTLTDGPVEISNELIVAPQGETVRIRDLQSHHSTVKEAAPGNRLAVNLTGIAHSDVSRGDVLVAPEDWHHSATIDAELTVLRSLDHDVSRRGAYLAYFGSGEFPAKLRVLGSEGLKPGSQGPIRLYLSTPIPLLPGDRFILRESGRDETVGGGEVLDVDPQLQASQASPDRSIDRVIAERSWTPSHELLLITGIATPPNVGNWVVYPPLVEEAKEAMLSLVTEAGALGLDVATLDERNRAILELLADVTVENGRAVLGEPDDPLADHAWVTALERDPFSPPGPDGQDRAEVRELVRRGTVVESDGVFFAATSLAAAESLVAGALEASPQGLTVAEVRDLLGTSRKFVLPILNWFDRTGRTRRRDDVRIAGPRLNVDEETPPEHQP